MHMYMSYYFTVVITFNLAAIFVGLFSYTLFSNYAICIETCILNLVTILVFVFFSYLRHKQLLCIPINQKFPLKVYLEVVYVQFILHVIIVTCLIKV